jgi:hypothetical protein
VTLYFFSRFMLFFSALVATALSKDDLEMFSVACVIFCSDLLFEQYNAQTIIKWHISGSNFHKTHKIAGKLAAVNNQSSISVDCFCNRLEVVVKRTQLY